jgi:predicted NUDIX family NTP pyrophosphohydrolase
MPVRSAGILLHRRSGGALEVYIAHMGGPFWAKKDARAWSVPKGEIESGEDELGAALREFGEEIGRPAPALPYERLGEFRQSSGKVVIVWTAEGDFDDAPVDGNTFELEWPPRSGRTQSFPEIDDARWFALDAARDKLVASQVPVLDRLAAHVGDA